MPVIFEICIGKCMYYDKSFPNFWKNPHEDVSNWIEWPEYSGKSTNDVAIWLRCWAFCPEFPEFSEKSIEFANVWLEFPEFSENSIEFADILPTISQLLG